jgi:glycosyltransferase involved in cell wall biosynthesis
MGRDLKATQLDTGRPGVVQQGLRGLKPSQGASVSVVVPVHNNETDVAQIINATDALVRKTVDDFEIVVVDDGSIDGTRGAARRAIQESGLRVQLVSYSRNQGKGYALKTAFGFTSGKKVIFMDNDINKNIIVGQDLLPSLLRGLDSVDIVVASKYLKSSRSAVPPLRRFLSLGFHAMTVLLTGLNLSDTQVGLKAYRRDAFERLTGLQLTKRYATDVELLCVAKLLGLRIREIPIEVVEHNRSFRPQSIMLMLVDLLGIAYRLRIRRWYQKNINEPKPLYKPIIPL